VGLGFQVNRLDVNGETTDPTDSLTHSDSRFEDAEGSIAGLSRIGRRFGRHLMLEAETFSAGGEDRDVHVVSLMALGRADLGQRFYVFGGGGLGLAVGDVEPYKADAAAAAPAAKAGIGFRTSETTSIALTASHFYLPDHSAEVPVMDLMTGDAVWREVTWEQTISNIGLSYMVNF
jgi:hypothetical protein